MRVLMMGEKAMHRQRLSAVRRPGAAWMRGRSLSRSLRPTPRTRVISSAEAKGRASMMALASAGPMPGRDSSCSCEPKLRSMRAGSASAVDRRCFTADSSVTTMPTMARAKIAKARQLHGTSCGIISATVRRRLLRAEDSDGMTVFEHKPENHASFQAIFIC
jgi:hypothetical protein